jgi:hypothetical protein
MRKCKKKAGGLWIGRADLISISFEQTLLTPLIDNLHGEINALTAHINVVRPCN